MLWADPEYRGAIIKILEMLTMPSPEEQERLRKEQEEQRKARRPKGFRIGKVA